MKFDQSKDELTIRSTDNYGCPLVAKFDNNLLILFDTKIYDSIILKVSCDNIKCLFNNNDVFCLLCTMHFKIVPLSSAFEFKFLIHIVKSLYWLQ